MLIKIYLPGLQSVKREQIDSKTFEIVKGTPVVFRDVQTDDSWTVDVAIIDSGAEHKDLLGSTESSTRYSVITYMGREFGKEEIHGYL